MAVDGLANDFLLRASGPLSLAANGLLRLGAQS